MSSEIVREILNGERLTFDFQIFAREQGEKTKTMWFFFLFFRQRSRFVLAITPGQTLAYLKITFFHLYLYPAMQPHPPVPIEPSINSVIDSLPSLGA